MIYRSIIFIILLLSTCNSIIAQNTSELSDKYVNYRNRLLEEWIIVSPEVEQFGVNIPAVDRILDSLGNPRWVSWSDGNSNFNHWLGILSTEYRLLKNNGQDYQETLSMLVYTMLALERLDLYSEYTLRKHHKTESFKTEYELIKYPEDINGFLIRDDVSLGFWRQYFRHFKSEYGWHNKTGDGTNRYLSVFQKGVIAKEGMSQDNIIYLLQSLALVKTLVDDENISKIELNFINDYIPDYLKTKGILNGKTISFDRWVDDLTDRLVRRCFHEYPEQEVVLKITTGKAHPSKTKFGGIMSSYWYIANPVTNDLVAEGNGEDMGVWMNSYGIAEAGNFITGKQSYHSDGSEKGLNAYLFKALLFKNLKFLKHGGFPVPDNIDDYMFRALASISDINWDESSYDLLYLLGDKRLGWTYEHNPLILYLLHTEKYKKVYAPGIEFYENDKKYYQELLGFAPFNGPSTDYTRIDYHPFWSSSSRLNWPNNAGNRNAKDVRDYAGMDYMFLYNLYRLVFEPEAYILPIDRRNEIVTKSAITYPVPELKGIDAEFYYLPPKPEK
ncbi:MAG: hypothetical protein PHH30_11895 [Bacteroidales bacterium]|nr:hypothetical protein [Bacteroidales bacterium]